jgi:hypothetical protein
MTGRHLLSHSFTEKGQRKKIIDDHDKLCSEIEISKLLSNNKIFQHRYQFSNISLMFVQTFRSYFSEEIFLSSLSEWLSAQVCVFFKKDKKLINSNQNQNRKQTKNANKNEIFT